MIELPWMPKELSPNARLHWTKRAKAAKAYRLECFILAKAAGITAPEGKILWTVEFFPPSRRAYDDDNLLARIKALRDGVADALGVDDRRFVTQFSVSETVIKGGLVRVTIGGLA
jgi:crossover junction endodeoxyribonuclease RusA